jgi:predicted  nucleic acid-binding Zn-ribbon protein
MERVEAARAAEQQAADELARIAAEGRRLMASKDEKTAGLSDEIAQQEAAREQALAGLPADLMTLYERIRSKSGVGAAMLRRGRCEGCRLQLTNEDMGRIRAAGPDTVLRCPECDRILVRTAESGL